MQINYNYVESDIQSSRMYEDEDDECDYDEK